MEILRKSWTQVAAGYKETFVPRFAPWIRDSLEALIRAEPPTEGKLFVAGCGTGEELVLAAERLPKHQIEAYDLAEGMVSMANSLVESHAMSHRVGVRVGDATVIPPDLHPISAVFSCFVLQQMPRPEEVLASWTRALAPNGVLCVCYWPHKVESIGPWQRMMEIDPPKGKDYDWERDLPGLAQKVGADICVDQRIPHTIEWPSAAAFWTGHR